MCNGRAKGRREREIWRCYSASVEDGGRGREQRNAALEAKKDMETNSPLEPLEGTQPCNTLFSDQWNTFQISHLQNYKIINVCCFGYMFGQNYNSKRYMQPYVHSSTIHNSQHMEILKCPPTDEWVKKMWYTQTHAQNGIFLNHMKKWNNSICSNMNGPRDYQSEVSQKETDNTQ